MALGNLLQKVFNVRGWSTSTRVFMGLLAATNLIQCGRGCILSGKLESAVRDAGFLADSLSVNTDFMGDTINKYKICGAPEGTGYIIVPEDSKGPYVVAEIEGGWMRNYLLKKDRGCVDLGEMSSYTGESSGKSKEKSKSESRPFE